MLQRKGELSLDSKRVYMRYRRPGLCVFDHLAGFRGRCRKSVRHLTASPQPQVSEQVLDKSAESSALVEYAPLSFVVGYASVALPTRSTLLEQKRALLRGREVAGQESRRERQDTPKRRRLFRIVPGLAARRGPHRARARDQVLPTARGRSTHKPRSLLRVPALPGLFAQRPPVRTLSPSS
jgi:hypothetical protein